MLQRHCGAHTGTENSQLHLQRTEVCHLLRNEVVKQNHTQISTDIKRTHAKNTYWITKYHTKLYIPAAPLAKEITVNPVVAWSASCMYKSATTALLVFSYGKIEENKIRTRKARTFKLQP